MKDLRRLLHYALSDGIPRRALFVALIVGTVLNLINQGDTLFGPKPVNLFKLVLTFIVPYVVSSHGAATARMAMIRDAGKTDELPRETD